MNAFLAFTKKEFLEQLRTYKWLLVFSILFIFGMISPLLAKLMPELLGSMQLEGMKIIIPEPTIMDAYVQYFKNLTQMGILMLLLVFGGTISNEIMKGTLVNILAKGLPRHTVILSKYTAAVALWTTGYALSAITAYGYTCYLFPNASVQNLIFSLFCLWLFGCFVIALIFLSSTLTTGNFGGLIVSAVILIIMLMVSSLPATAKFNPVMLAAKNTALLDGSQSVKGLMITVMITAFLTLACLYCSVLLFRRKKL
jgi:hypothetical protein